MYQCEAMFGIERGLAIQAVVEKSTGKPCPCTTGEKCILEAPQAAPLTRLARVTAGPPAAVIAVAASAASALLARG